MICLVMLPPQARADAYFANHEDWPAFCMRVRDVTLTESQLNEELANGSLAQRIADLGDLTVKTGPPDMSFSAWPYYDGTLYVDASAIDDLSAGSSATVTFYMDASVTASDYVTCRVTVVADAPSGGNGGDGDIEDVPPDSGSPPRPGTDDGEGGDEGNERPSAPGSSQNEYPPYGTEKAEGDEEQTRLARPLEEITVGEPRSEASGGSSLDESDPKAGDFDGSSETASDEAPDPLSPLIGSLEKLWRAFTYSPITVAGFSFALVLFIVIGVSALLDGAVLLHHRKRKEEWLCSHR